MGDYVNNEDLAKLFEIAKGDLFEYKLDEDLKEDEAEGVKMNMNI